MTKMLSVCLPFFPGFYYSDLSDALEREVEQWAEYHVDDNGAAGPDYEASWPDALRLTNDDLSGLAFRHTDYQAAQLSLARQWVDAFNYHAGEILNLSEPDTRKRWTGEGFTTEAYARPSIGLRFEEMTSPREYNFTTDDAFAFIPLKVVRDLFKRSAAERHATLAKVIVERHSSRPGFISFYRSDVREWLKKPLREWDHNEIGTLLWAALDLAGAKLESDCYYSGFTADVRETALENEGASQAWEGAMNWPAFDAERAQMRRAKLAAWIVADADAANAWLEANLDHAADMGLPMIAAEAGQ